MEPKSEPDIDLQKETCCPANERGAKNKENDRIPSRLMPDEVRTDKGGSVDDE